MKKIRAALLLLSLSLPSLATAAPSPAAAPVLQIDVRGSLMTCFFGGYTYRAEVVAGTVPRGGPPLAGTLHVGLGGESPIDPLELGGLFRVKALATAPQADGTCAAPALAAVPDGAGRCWSLAEAVPVADSE